MRKAEAPGFRPSLPRNSANASLTNDPLAATGATNRFRDEDTQYPNVEHVGGHNDLNIGPNDSRIRSAVASSGTANRDATVTAIQMDWKRRKEQMGQAFANRPLGTQR
jgi:hypothetical protein